jgi:hypothetical protein
MPARGWWWQRFHPALRAIVAVAYFGTALAIIVYAVTPSFHTAPASRPDITQEQASGSTTTDAGPPLAEPPSEQDEPDVLTGGELYEIIALGPTMSTRRLSMDSTQQLRGLSNTKV